MHTYDSKIAFKRMCEDLQGPFTSRKLRAHVLPVNFLPCKLKMLRDFQGN